MKKGTIEEMVYLYYSAESELARRTALRSLRKAHPHRDEGNFILLNMAESSLRDLLNECESISLMSEKKAIFAENCAFLAKDGKTSKKGKPSDLEQLAEYCLNPNPDTDLYLVVYSATLAKKNPVVDAISQNGITREVLVPKKEEWIEKVHRYLSNNGHSIDEEAAEEVVNRVHGDYGRFACELQKLSSIPNSNITIEDIKSLIAPRLEDDTFALSNALLSGNLSQAIAIYHDLKSFSNDEFTLINMLGSQFRFLEQVCYLSKGGLNKFDIAKELNQSPYRVGCALSNLRYISLNSIIIAQERLYKSQDDILSGNVDPEFAFTRFLAEFSYKK